MKASGPQIWKSLKLERKSLQGRSRSSSEKQQQLLFPCWKDDERAAPPKASTRAVGQ